MAKMLKVSKDGGKTVIQVPEATFKRWPSVIVGNQQLPNQGYRVFKNAPEISKAAAEVVEETAKGAKADPVEAAVKSSSKK
jgi:hypothetical protein